MAINKVVLGDQTLIDLTSDTVTPDTLAVGATAHDKTGASIVGTMSGGGGGTDPGRFGGNYDIWVGAVDANGKLGFSTVSDPVDLVFTGVKDVDTWALAYAFYTGNTKSVKSVSFPDLEDVTGTYALSDAFYSQKKLTSVSFPKLMHVSGGNAFHNAFRFSRGIVEVSFPSLLTVVGVSAFSNSFEGVSTLTSISFPVLTQIGSNTHTYSSNGGAQFYSVITNPIACNTLSFPELTAIYCTGTVPFDGTFAYNSALQRIDLPKLSVIDISPAYTGTSSLSSHKNIFYGCSKLTEIHFGAANQAAIEATEGYSTLWGRGAGNATVYFDL